MTVDSQQYAALTTGVGFAELRDWTQIELTGADRLKFLNNFCTADLSKLAPMRGAEAFICNVKGKVLGHVFILNDYDRLFLVTVPGQAQTLIPHLDRYTLRDDVALRDVSGEARLIQLAGNSAASLAEQTLATHVNERRLDQQLPRHWLESCECLLHREIPSLIARGLIGPESFLYRTGEFIVMQHIEYLRSQGAVECDEATLDAVRIEYGMPLYGRDITLENLPQEVNRNAQAISFTKGCYLGQETVARIDALGHVNRLLVGVKFAGERIPSPGDELQIEGKPVGQVTSAAFSPRLAKPLALAYVRTASAAPGTRLASPVGDAEIVALPLA